MDLFLGRKRFYKWVSILPEEKLFGTAGTIRENKKIFRNKPLLLIHGDNWSNLNIPSFLAFNKKLHLTNCVMTMVNFFTTQPEFCGIVTLNDQKVVNKFHYYQTNPNDLYGQLPIRDALKKEYSKYAPFLNDWYEHQSYDK